MMRMTNWAIAFTTGGILAACGVDQAPTANPSVTAADAAAIREAQQSPEVTKYIDALRAAGWTVDDWSSATVLHATPDQLQSVPADSHSSGIGVELGASRADGSTYYAAELIYADGEVAFDPLDQASNAQLGQSFADHLARGIPDVACTGSYWSVDYIRYGSVGYKAACVVIDGGPGAVEVNQGGYGWYGQVPAGAFGCAQVVPLCTRQETSWTVCEHINTSSCNGL